MPTVQQIQQHIKESIEEVYASPENGAIAQLVLEHVLQKSRLQLSLGQQEEVSSANASEVDSIIHRLQQHEPVQYILGVAHFYDMELQVDERVLIPRPETEELVHLVIKDHQGQENLKIMDICTGSGCIPLALAANIEGSTIYGLEVSGGALEVAKANAAKYNLQVEWLHQDIFEPLPAIIAPGSLDIITSNPPYVLEEEKQLMRTNVLDFEPHLALFVPDTDPLKFYKRITQVAKELLHKGGHLYFEINERYGAETCAFLLQEGYTQAEVKQDLFQKDRIVVATL
ncbi:peptide chain release factor N(5)-glutamine methyltransferase [Pontibacter sp. SGAir0037]|uniref:peptide chain release factor N(5)-glutamine methyltransferase n=1 Tax=Pontibacter sp. SGAir0037 TaxID=2571030 RepID=UPI0010CD4547|nr:peptide chain release factor N(5)-glutamine methyltransferase [Pontibacter sp. SGAir0037]QCR24103.1 peptide chain release factor N(5)-glutamine methyltransferase [Pontibacter sp. SGAir0037]